MLRKLLLGISIVFVALLLVLLGISISRSSDKPKSVNQEQAQEASISDALLLNKNLKEVLNVHKEITIKQQKADTSFASEIWLVPRGRSIPNYMLLASREIERCKGKIHWMREIRNGQAALLKYEGEQGIYPLTEVRIMDSLWLPNSSKLAVVLALRENNSILKNKPEILEKLDFKYNLLIPSSRQELLDAAKKINANVIPRIPLEGGIVYSTEKRNMIPIGINEKKLSKMLDEIMKKFNNASGFATFYGDDFLVHQASMEVLGNVLRSKNLWLWDLSESKVASLSSGECSKKDLRCLKNYLHAESNKQIEDALRTARRKGKAILLFELTEKSVELLKDLPGMAEKQGTAFVVAEEVF